MPAAKQPPSVPGSHHPAILSARDAALGPVRRVKRLYKTKASPQRSAATIGVATGLAFIFPLPFTILGVLAAVDDALNAGDDAEELKAFLVKAVKAVQGETPEAPVTKKNTKGKNKNGATARAAAPAAG